MASRIRVQCPNCQTAYRQNARFCSVCGRARDEKSDAETAAEKADPNRSVMMVASPARTAPVSSPRRSLRTASPTASDEPLPLPSLKPGVVVTVAILFFGLVWIGRRWNAPQKPSHPTLAPISVVKPDDAEARRVKRQLEANEKRDLREAEEYADGIRAQAAADHLQAQLRNSQVPPPSEQPKSFDVIQLPAQSQGTASQTDSQGYHYPAR